MPAAITAEPQFLYLFMAAIYNGLLVYYRYVIPFFVEHVIHPVCYKTNLSFAGG